MNEGLSKPDATSRVVDAADLCESCGLCCSGLLFEHVRVEPHDHAVRERIDLDAGADQDIRMLHPCPFLAGTRCSVYEVRPSRCRDYLCQTRRELLNGTIARAEALGRIATMKARLETLAENVAAFVTRPLQEIGFRNFYAGLEQAVDARLSAGKPVADVERDAVFQAFEIVQQIDREFAKTRRLDRAANLVERLQSTR